MNGPSEESCSSHGSDAVVKVVLSASTYFPGDTIYCKVSVSRKGVRRKRPQHPQHQRQHHQAQKDQQKYNPQQQQGEREERNGDGDVERSSVVQPPPFHIAWISAQSHGFLQIDPRWIVLPKDMKAAHGTATITTPSSVSPTLPATSSATSTSSSPSPQPSPPPSRTFFSPLFNVFSPSKLPAPSPSFPSSPSSSSSPTPSSPSPFASTSKSMLYGGVSANATPALSPLQTNNNTLVTSSSQGARNNSISGGGSGGGSRGIKTRQTTVVTSMSSTALPDFKEAADDNLHCLFATDASILACDVNLDDGDTLNYFYYVTLPSSLPPTYQGAGVKSFFFITVAAQIGISTSKLLRIPVRIISPEGAIRKIPYLPQVFNNQAASSHQRDQPQSQSQPQPQPQSPLNQQKEFATFATGTPPSSHHHRTANGNTADLANDMLHQTLTAISISTADDVDDLGMVEQNHHHNNNNGSNANQTHHMNHNTSLSAEVTSPLFQSTPGRQRPPKSHLSTNFLNSSSLSLSLSRRPSSTSLSSSISSSSASSSSSHRRPPLPRSPQPHGFTSPFTSSFYQLNSSSSSSSSSSNNNSNHHHNNNTGDRMGARSLRTDRLSPLPSPQMPSSSSSSSAAPSPTASLSSSSSSSWSSSSSHAGTATAPDYGCANMPANKVERDQDLENFVNRFRTLRSLVAPTPNVMMTQHDATATLRCVQLLYEQLDRPGSFVIRGDDGRKIVTISLPTRSYSLGCEVRGTLDFSDAEIPCHQVSAYLDCVQKIDPSVVNPKRMKTEISRNLCEQHEHTRNVLLSHFLFYIPVTSPHEFATELVSVSYSLRFEFIIARRSPSSERPPPTEQTDDDFLLEERQARVQRELDAQQCTQLRSKSPLTKTTVQSLSWELPLRVLVPECPSELRAPYRPPPMLLG